MVEGRIQLLRQCSNMQARGASWWQMSPVGERASVQTSDAIGGNSKIDLTETVISIAGRERVLSASKCFHRIQLINETAPN